MDLAQRCELPPTGANGEANRGRAAELQWIAGCVSIRDDEQRLSCYDARASIPAPTFSTRDVVQLQNLLKSRYQSASVSTSECTITATTRYTLKSVNTGSFRQGGWQGWMEGGTGKETVIGSRIDSSAIPFGRIDLYRSVPLGDDRLPIVLNDGPPILSSSVETRNGRTTERYRNRRDRSYTFRLQSGRVAAALSLVRKFEEYCRVRVD